MASGLTSLNTNMLRISGLSSGLDTDSMVTSLMKLEQLKLDKRVQEKQTLEWKKSYYTELSTQLKSFRADFFSMQNAAKSMYSNNSLNNFKGTITGAAGKVSFVAGVYAQAKSYSIESATMATAAKATGSSTGTELSLSASIESLAQQGLLGSDFAFTETPVTDSAGNPVYVPKLNASGSPIYVLKKDANGDPIQQTDANGNPMVDSEGMPVYEIETDAAGNRVYEPELDANGDPIQQVTKSFSFSVNGEAFTFSGTSSLRSVMNTVNANAKANVSMSYSTLTQSFSIASKTLGVGTSLTLDDVPAGGGNHVFGGANSLFKLSTSDVQAGADGEMWIKEEGMASYSKITSKTNSFSVDGSSIMLSKDITAADAVGVDVTRDVEASVNKIKTFVEGFNKLMDTLYAKIYEERFKGYAPLTDDQRTAMTESEIKQWEDKARSGLFRGDNELISFANSLRSAFTSTMSQVGGKTAASIGLSFGEYSSSDKNHVVIDEEKLRKALAEDPGAVSSMFNNPEEPAAFGAQGIAQRLDGLTNNFNKKLTNTNLSALEKSLKDNRELMLRMEEQMVEKEERLWAQFSAMETAMTKLNSQKSSLAALLGG